ncbi:hypothetical protein BDZ91DRAFT_848548 [Kalaharituber pfeilii]|nr:hypothetical protein BDZ91DRAFT_848548 [Kalaharituber pfeilii]
MNTRSHLRIYHTNPRGKSSSSTVFPLSPAGPCRITYAVRRKPTESMGGVEHEELIVDRVYLDVEKDETPVGNRAQQGEDESSDDMVIDEGGESNDDMRKRRKQEQEALELISPALIYIHVFPSGSTFLEAMPPAKNVSLVRLAPNHSTPSTRIPGIIPSSTSSPGGEKVLIFLDCDSLITIDNAFRLMYQTVEMSIAVPSTDQGGAEEIEMPATSDKDYEDRASETAEVEGGLATPPILQPGKEITRVLDTPHGKERFIDPLQGETQISLFDPTPQTGPGSAWLESGVLPRYSYGKDDAKMNDDEMALEDTDDENIIPTLPAGLPLVADSSSRKKPTTNADNSAPSVIGTLPPSSGANAGDVGDTGDTEYSTAPTKPAHHATQDERESTTESEKNTESRAEETKEKIYNDDLPDSLPEDFHIRRRSLNTPAGQKTYSSRGRKVSNEKTKQMETALPSSIPESSRPLEASDAPSEEILEAQGPRESQPPTSSILGNNEGENSSPQLHPTPKASVQGNRVKKMEIEESSQLEPETTNKQEGESEKQGKEGSQETIKRESTRRPRLKRSKLGETEPTATEKPTHKPKRKRSSKRAEANGDTEEAESQVDEEMAEVEDVDSEVGGTMESRIEVQINKENQKRPRKRVRKSLTGKEKEKEKATGTQYTFQGSDSEGEHHSEEDNEEAPPPTKPTKTPIKRASRKSTGSVATATDTPTKEKSTGASPSHNFRTNFLYKGDPPKVVFSNSSFANRKDLGAVLRSLGVKKAIKVTDRDVGYLVVGKGGLVRSSKLALAVALGIPIIEDTWLLDSHINSALLQPTPHYCPHDPTHESEWSFSLEDAIARGKSGMISKLLAGYDTIYITPTLLSQLKISDQEAGFIDILKAAGANKVVKRAPRGTKEEELGKNKKGLVFGGEKEKERDLVTWVEENGWGVFRPEMLTMSVLRGKLEVDQEEFKLTPPPSGSSIAREEGSIGSGTAGDTVASTAAPSRGRRKSGR